MVEPEAIIEGRTRLSQRSWLWQMRAMVGYQASGLHEQAIAGLSGRGEM